MLTLYYSPGACSMAPHIALEEAGVSYTPQLVSIPKGEHLTGAYLQNVNPRGKVPALRTEHGVLTENVAILTYIARSFSGANLLPEEPIFGCIGVALLGCWHDRFPSMGWVNPIPRWNRRPSEGATQAYIRRGGGLIGNGCVGDVHSPGAVVCGTLRSSMPKIGSPVTRSKMYT